MVPIALDWKHSPTTASNFLAVNRTRSSTIMPRDVARCCFPARKTLAWLLWKPTLQADPLLPTVAAARSKPSRKERPASSLIKLTAGRWVKRSRNLRVFTGSKARFAAMQRNLIALSLPVEYCNFSDRLPPRHAPQNLLLERDCFRNVFLSASGRG